jgi:hypothetical protein
MELFNWAHFDNDIHIGSYNSKTEASELRQRKTGRHKKDLERRRNIYRAKRIAMGKTYSRYST